MQLPVSKMMVCEQNVWFHLDTAKVKKGLFITTNKVRTRVRVNQGSTQGQSEGGGGGTDNSHEYFFIIFEPSECCR